MSLSCGGGGGDPTQPGPGPQEPPSLVSIEVSPGVNLIPLGRFVLEVDPETLNFSFDQQQVRSATELGDRFLIDATRIFQSQEWVNNFRPTGVRRNESGNIEVDFRLDHPLPLPDLEAEASDTNRLDLHVFGPHIIALSETPGIAIEEGVLVDPSLIANPHGFSAAFPEEVTGTTTNLHPYRVLFQTDPAVDAANLGTGNFDPDLGFPDPPIAPVGYNVFPQGGSAFGTVEFFPKDDRPFADDLLIAAYYIDPKTTSADRLPNESGGPFYFAPAGAGVSPWWVDLTVTETDLVANNPGGSVEVEVRVYDWQVGLDAAENFPDKTNPDGLPAASAPGTVTVAIPEISDSPMTAILADNAEEATGFFGDPLIYTVSVPNTIGPLSGEYPGFVRVDDQAPATNAGNVSQVGNDDLFGLNSTATYQAFLFEVPPGTNPPVVSLNVAEEFVLGQEVLLDASESCDSDGEIVEYLWDLDFDGTFDPTLMTESPTLNLNELDPEISCRPSDGAFTVAVQAVDNDGFMSVIVCDEPSPESTFEAASCTVTGDLPKSCQTTIILPREGLPAFATDVDVAGSPAASAPFADTHSSGQHGLVVRGERVYVTWHAIDFGFDFGNVFVAVSDNGGASFPTPTNLSMNVAPQVTPEEPDPEAESANHPTLAVSEDGETVVVVYADGPHLDQNIVIHPSTDGGLNFAADISPQRIGNQGFPSVALAPDNTLYFAYVDFDGTAGDRIWAGTGALDSTELALDAINDVVSDEGASIRFTTDVLVSQMHPSIIYQPNGPEPRMAVIWTDGAVVGNDRSRIMADSTSLDNFGFGNDFPVTIQPAVGVYQFQPSPAINPATGRLAVAYRQAESVDGSVISDILFTESISQSLPGGFTPPVRITDSTNMPRYAFAPSLSIGPAGRHFVAWQGAPDGNLSNYDIFIDSSEDGSDWGVDTNEIENEDDGEGGIALRQGFNPMIVTTGCEIYVGWAGSFDPRDTQNSFTVFVDVGT